MCTRFVLGAHARHANQLPGDRDLGGWLCLMQHYGLPTRLLDWTMSPLAAAFFAVSYNPTPGPGAIWVLAPALLNKRATDLDHGMLLLSGPAARELLQPAFGFAAASTKVMAVVGRDVDFRMIMQQGGFTIHGDATPLESQPYIEGALAKLVIPEAAKQTFIDELWSMGVRRSALFPDLGNLAKELAEERTIPRIKKQV